MHASGSFDVAVIGGGLVGAAVAFGLRSLGPKLALLDEGDVAYRAARANFGLVWVQGKGAGFPRYASWTQDSAGEWPRLASELLRESGVDVALAQPGGVHVCVAAKELEQRVAMLDALQSQPGFRRYPIEVLDRNALTELVARERRIPPEQAGYFRLRWPVKPITLAELAAMPGSAEAERAVVRDTPH